MFCWENNEPRFDLLGATMPAWVWHRWQMFMRDHPDSPRHRDQLFCDLAWLQMYADRLEGDIEPADMMERRLKEPWKPGAET